MQKIWLIIVVFSVSLAQGRPLAQILVLPTVMDRYLGRADVFYDSTPHYTIGTYDDSTKMIVGNKVTFFITHSNVTQERQQLARLSMDILFDKLFNNQMLRKTWLSIPGDPNSSIPIRKRITDFAISKLNGGSPDDKFLNIWWDLRLNSSGNDPRVSPKLGDPMLVATRLYGYKGSDFTVGDVGHSSMGVLLLGGLNGTGDRSADVFLNPGAKTPEGYESSRTNSMKGDPSVPNRIEKSNFWEWLQTQVDDRYLSVDLRILKITRKQQEAAGILMNSADKLTYGTFMMIANNCASGARDFFDSLLPIDYEIPRGVAPFIPIKDWAPIDLPEVVLNGTSQAFGVLERLNYTAHRPAGVLKTPDTNVIHFDNIQGLSTFEEYKRWEDCYLRR